MQKNKVNIVLVFISIIILVACSRNDYSTDYQKEFPYEGSMLPIDTMMIDVYTVTYADSVPSRNKPHSSITKWYDQNGYKSMIKSIVYLDNGERETLEKISRDKNSLPIARDISIQSMNAETIATLARLKMRSKGKEEWLLRHYLDPKRYLEDTSFLFYTSSAIISKKKDVGTDSLIVISVDTFDDKGLLVSREPSEQAKESEFITNFYNEKNLLDSIVSKTFKGNNPDSLLLGTSVEAFKYEFNEKGNVVVKYTYHKDSLRYISDYRYAYRK